METLKMLEKEENLQWDSDTEADVLYISIGKPVKQNLTGIENRI